MMKKQSKQNQARRRQMTEAISHPPQIGGYQLSHSVKLRFTSNAAFDSSIAFQNLLDTFLVATSATALFRLFTWVKIRKLEVWAIPVIGNSTTVAVAFAGTTVGQVGVGTQYTDMSMGVQPAHVSCRPPARSLAADWQVASANSAFSLNVPSGAVIDVSLSFKGIFNAAVAAVNAGVGATTGAMYLRGLDGLATATTALPPTQLAEVGSSI
jgi:hypothetical protein